MDTGFDPAAAGPPQSSDTGGSFSRLPAATQQQQHQHQNYNQNQIPDHLVMKLTRGHSCVLCQQRKVRCDRRKPCANCVKANVECKVVPPQPPRRRRKKPHERDLIDRLKKYEALLAQHGVNFEPIADDFKASDNADDIADLGQDLSGLKTSPESSVPDHTQGDGDEKSVSQTTAYTSFFSLPTKSDFFTETSSIFRTSMGFVYLLSFLSPPLATLYLCTVLSHPSLLVLYRDTEAQLSFLLLQGLLCPGTPYISPS